MGMAGAERAKELGPGVGVPQVADRVPNVGTHAGRRLGGRPLAPRDRVPERGQRQGWGCVNSRTTGTTTTMLSSFHAVWAIRTV